MQQAVEWFQTHMSFLPPQMAVMLVSMLPLIELRGGIPLARVLMLPLHEAIIFSVIGNIIPIPFILLFINRIFDWLRPTKLFGGIVERLEKRALSKSEGVAKAEFLGLVLFVGIPIPGTGGWTGALIASLLKVDIRKASLAILLGIAIAATIMSLISYGVFRM
ncbi:MAG: small multi-drug export protein [Lachnospiraceae bacterium]|nr:small multi-drug export protein [Lachnospiraceae bacterium]